VRDLPEKILHRRRAWVFTFNNPLKLWIIPKRLGRFVDDERVTKTALSHSPGIGDFASDVAALGAR